MGWQVSYYKCTNCGSSIGRKPGLCVTCRVKLYGYKCTKCGKRAKADQFLDNRCPHCGVKTDFEWDRAVHFDPCQFCGKEHRHDREPCPYCGRYSLETGIIVGQVLCILFITVFAICLKLGSSYSVLVATGVLSFLSLIFTIVTTLYYKNKGLVNLKQILPLYAAGAFILFVLLSLSMCTINYDRKLRMTQYSETRYIGIKLLKPVNYEQGLEFDFILGKGKIIEYCVTGIQKDDSVIPLEHWIKTDSDVLIFPSPLCVKLSPQLEEIDIKAVRSQYITNTSSEKHYDQIIIKINREKYLGFSEVLFKDTSKFETEKSLSLFQ